MRVRRFIHFLLFFVAVVLLWRTTAIWSRTVPSFPMSPAQAVPQEEQALRFAPTPVPAVGRQLAQTIADKDLFSPSRSRTVEEQAPAVASVPPPAHLKLVGVLLSPQHEEAFFSDSSQGGKVVRVQKGETLGVYKLASVGPLEVTLMFGQNGEQVNLPLEVIDSSSAARVPHLVPSAPQPATSPMRARQARAGDTDTLGEETQAIRQNIQQLQQRLRQIRRQAARQQAARQEIGGEREMAEEEEGEAEE